MSQKQIKQLLTNYKVVAVVGLSKDPTKDSHRVSAYLKQHGYHIIPINPSAEMILGAKSYRSLLDIPVEIQKIIEIVDIFRPPKEVPAIVEQIIRLKTLHGRPYVVWMQLGIINEEAAESAKKAGLITVMDKCMMIEHHNLLG